MGISYSDVITRNVLFAMHQSGAGKGAVASALGIDWKTLAKRLRDGEFTVGQLATIATLTGTTLSTLLADLVEDAA